MAIMDEYPTCQWCAWVVWARSRMRRSLPFLAAWQAVRGSLAVMPPLGGGG